MQPVEVVGVRVELPANQPVVLLKETTGVRYLPIWIGAVEANAIAFHQQGTVSERPLTHDLLRDVVGALKASLTEVRITELRDEIFFAELVFDDAVLEAAGILIPDNDDDDSTDNDGDSARDPIPEGEVERFREFLDQISPEDFASGA
jgi:bifunctional DNase/RNase